MDKLIIEVRTNEYVSRDTNPNLPYTSEEIARDAAECREAGAAIFHFHARKADGSPSHDTQDYADTVRRIRGQCDLLIHPTLGFITATNDEERIAPIMALASDPATKPDIAPMDMGSTNVDTYDHRNNRFLTKNRVYANSIGTLEFFACKLRESGIIPSMLAWSIPDTRTIEAFLALGLVSEPAFITFVVSDSYIGAHPATAAGLEAHLMFLPKNRQVHWSVIAKGTSILPFAETAIYRGGHVSLGLGDYGYPELGAPTNADLVRRVVTLAKEAGREIATPQDARQMLTRIEQRI